MTIIAARRSTRIRSKFQRVLVLAASIFAAGPVNVAFAQEDAIERGAYLIRAAGCIACHTDHANEGVELAGGRALETPFGTFYSPNITPDEETGIGAWSDEDFLRALREGEAPEGHSYYPVFPFASYTLMRDEDALAIKAYLFSLDAVSQENREHDVGFPLSWRFTLNGWRMLHFSEGPMEDDESQSEEWNRGRYLVDALGHCGECHTPRGMTGGMDGDMYLAGNREGPDNEVVPNITPHETGLANWSASDIAGLLKSGLKPDWDSVQGSMEEAIDDGLSYLTDDDLAAIATYLQSVPAIENSVSGE